MHHPELFELTIAHIDCDAFYASVEKRDRPDLAARPVVVGGGVRGVVTAACYIARMYGVHSAMPMFKALKACPDAVVIRPDFSKYVAVGRQIRTMMVRLTPLLQPLSIDEAVVDLAGTQALHAAPPAVVLARFAREVEAEVGITVSIGLAPNRLLAKIAAGRNKPRGFAVIGAAEAASLLASEPVRLLPGIGPALARRLAGQGITLLGHLQALTEREARRRLGLLPDRLFDAARSLLVREATGTAFRLIGIGAHPLLPLADADHGDLADLDTPRRAATQAAIDALRQRFGISAISRGRGWAPSASPLPRGEGE